MLNILGQVWGIVYRHYFGSTLLNHQVPPVDAICRESIPDRNKQIFVLKDDFVSVTQLQSNTYIPLL